MIPDQEIIEQVQDILMPILREEGLEAVDIEFRPSGKRWLLRVFIDKEGGVTITDCETVSRELSRVLDVDDIIAHPYTLEVSSPGLTRALRKADDFRKYRGKLCKIITREPIEGKNEFHGEIGDITDEALEIKGKLDVFTIPICAIKKAQLEFEL